MNEAQIAHLKEIGFAKHEKIAPIPESIYDNAKYVVGAAAAIIPFSDPKTFDFFPGCTHLAYVPWMKTQGLWAEYEAFLSGEEKESMDINSARRLDQAKEISDEANGIPKVPKVPVAPPVEKPKTEVIESRFKSYVQRLEYIKEQGFVHDVSAKGYLKDNKHYIDANVIKNFDAPENVIDVEFKKMVANALENTNWGQDVQEPEVAVPDITAGLTATPAAEILADKEEVVSELQLGQKIADLESVGWEWSIENNIFTLPESPLKLTREEVDKVLIALWPTFLEGKALIAKNNAERIERAKAVEEPKVDFSKEIIEKRTKVLTDFGFVVDAATYMFVRGDWEISSRMVKDLTDEGAKKWLALVEQIKDVIAKEKTAEKIAAKEAQEKIAAEKAAIEEVDKWGPDSVQFHKTETTEEETPWPGDHQEMEQREAEIADEKAKEVVVNEPEEVVSEEKPAEIKIFTEDELKKIPVADLKSHILEVLKVEIPAEGSNTNKKLRTIILNNQPKPKKDTALDAGVNRWLKNHEADEVKKEDAVLRETIVTASSDIAQQLKIVEQVQQACDLFYKTHYAISLIENHLNAENVSPEMRIKLIQKTIDNIKK